MIELMDAVSPLVPKIYDRLKTQGYSNSYIQFLADAINLVAEHKQYLLYRNFKLELDLNILEEYEQLRFLIDKLKQFQSLEAELDVYQNEELVLLQKHLQTLQPFLTKNKIKVPKTIPSSFSQAHDYLISISSFLH